MFLEKGESHNISKCSKLTQWEYKKIWHNVARYVQQYLFRKGYLEGLEKWYELKPDGIIEN